MCCCKWGRPRVWSAASGDPDFTQRHAGLWPRWHTGGVFPIISGFYALVLDCRFLPFKKSPDYFPLETVYIYSGSQSSLSIIPLSPLTEPSKNLQQPVPKGEAISLPGLWGPTGETHVQPAPLRGWPAPLLGEL